MMAIQREGPNLFKTRFEGNLELVVSNVFWATRLKAHSLGQDIGDEHNADGKLKLVASQVKIFF